MPLRSEGQARTTWQNAALALPLAAVAGSVNAAGFFLLGTHTSHMTGQAAAFGESVAVGNFSLALVACGMLVAFAIGAGCVAALLDMTFSWRRARYTPVLLAEGAVLAVAAGLASRHLPEQLPRIALCLAFAMGMQNAVVTRISGAVVRTTHITGVITDLGMELWALLRIAVLRVVNSSTQPLPLLATVRAALLHVGLVVAFVLGAVGGGVLLQRFEAGAFVLPFFTLCALVVLDLRTSHANKVSVAS